MYLNWRTLLHFLYFAFLWEGFKVEAYDGICEEPNASIYCTCDTRHRESTTGVVCFIISSLHKDDDVWRSLIKVENVITLKLQSMSSEWLTYIPSETLQELDSLRTLDIQKANLSELQSNALSGLKELRELKLEGNEITKLHPLAIANLPKLGKLSLSENLLTEILANSLVNLLELEKLFLDRNNIERVEAYAFSELPNLKELELQDNQITDLTDYMFRGLRYLTRLDLYKNKIRILNDKVFQPMPRLVEIDLKDNLISHIAPHTFEGLDKLQRLMLNVNQIKVLPDQVFKSLPSLRAVDLYHNKLETLQEEVVKNIAMIKDRHFSLAFKENPLICDCRLSWVKSYLKHNKSHQLTRELTDLKCRYDGENETLHSVHSLKMDCKKRPNKKEIITTSRSVTQPVNFVPYEIHGRQIKNKTADVTREDEYFSHDAGSQEKLEEITEQTPAKHSGSAFLSGNAHLTMSISLMTVFLVRKRKGTLI